jgi:hypothetical protein
MVEASSHNWRDICERCGLRKAYRQAEPEQRARIVNAGKAIRRAQSTWPTHAQEHVQRVLEAVRALG